MLPSAPWATVTSPVSVPKLPTPSVTVVPLKPMVPSAPKLAANWPLSERSPSPEIAAAPLRLPLRTPFGPSTSVPAPPLMPTEAGPASSASRASLAVMVQLRLPAAPASATSKSPARRAGPSCRLPLTGMSNWAPARSSVSDCVALSAMDVEAVPAKLSAVADASASAPLASSTRFRRSCALCRFSSAYPAMLALPISASEVSQRRPAPPPAGRSVVSTSAMSAMPRSTSRPLPPAMTVPATFAPAITNWSACTWLPSARVATWPVRPSTESWPSSVRMPASSAWIAPLSRVSPSTRLTA